MDVKTTILAVSMLAITRLSFAEENRTVGIVISQDSKPSIVYRIDELFRIGFGYHKTSNELKVQNTKREKTEYSYVLRTYVINNERADWFIDLVYKDLSVDYTGNTTNTNYSIKEKSIYGGIETAVSDHVHIDGRIGIMSFDVDYGKETENGSSYPASEISLTILF